MSKIDDILSKSNKSDKWVLIWKSIKSQQTLMSVMTSSGSNKARRINGHFLKEIWILT